MLVLRLIDAEFHLKQVKLNDLQEHLRTDKSVPQKLVEECFVLYFEAAHEAIDIFQPNLDLDTVTGPVPAWWFGVLCKKTISGHEELSYSNNLVVYTAATALLVERLRPTDPSASMPEPRHANTP